MISIEGIPLMKPPYGTITAIDLSKGTLAWQIVHGETPDAHQEPSACSRASPFPAPASPASWAP